MSDYTFDVEDFDGDETPTQSSGADTDLLNSVDLEGLAVLPLTVIGVFTFVQQSAVLSALVALTGSTALSQAITYALFIVGGVTTGVIGLAGLFGLLTLLGGVVLREPALLLVSLVVGVVVAGLWAGATFVFTGVPLLVGVVLTLNAVAYAIYMVIAVLGVIVAVASL
jgi:hypothetical protein